MDHTGPIADSVNVQPFRAVGMRFTSNQYSFIEKNHQVRAWYYYFFYGDGDVLEIEINLLTCLHTYPLENVTMSL